MVKYVSLHIYADPSPVLQKSPPCLWDTEIDSNVSWSSDCQREHKSLAPSSQDSLYTLRNLLSSLGNWVNWGQSETDHFIKVCLFFKSCTSASFSVKYSMISRFPQHPESLVLILFFEGATFILIAFSCVISWTSCLFKNIYKLSRKLSVKN